VAVDDVAMNSLLALPREPRAKSSSVPGPSEAEFDGDLTAGQVAATWKLDADLVVLSACQTGLGRFAGGEGFLGLAQAFFVAGARSLILSQWSIAEGPTILLMERFYQNLLGRRAGLKEPMSRAKALDEAKRWLRSLPLGQAAAALDRIEGRPVPRNVPLGLTIRPFEHPKHWAGLILTGDPR
jgi:CHAT domain-containing protein